MSSIQTPTPKVHTNAELAGLYRNFKISMSTRPVDLSRSMGAHTSRISGCPTEIHGLFIRTGSLSELAKVGIGEKIRADLETILRGQTGKVIDEYSRKVSHLTSPKDDITKPDAFEEEGNLAALEG